MTLPNFLIIGAHKSGTTWLSRVLSEHPDVFVAKGEVKFFSSSENLNQGVDWYCQHFENANQESAIGEKSPAYLYISAHHIYELLPTAKLIIILRDPVKRAISHARHYMRQAKFGSAISPFASLDHLIFESDLGKGILERGYYAKYIKTYYEYFDPNQFLVIINEEEVEKDPESLMRKACNFLEVDPNFEFKIANQKIHVGNLSRIGIVSANVMPYMKRYIHWLDRKVLGEKFNLSVSSETLQKLYNLYDEENKELFELLGRRCCW